MNQPVFFFTSPDPNFRIKGSRDPLGFQTIWQRGGRQLIRYLSTVSVDLMDFRILSLGWHVWGSRPDDGFVPFFLRLEQACAYARFQLNPNLGFNGVDFIRKQSRDVVEIGNHAKATILSNQRNAGIFGRYIRPFLDIAYFRQDNFAELIEEAITRSGAGPLLQRLIRESELSLSMDDLQPLQHYLRDLSVEERDFYRKSLLLTPGDFLQNELYEHLIHRPEWNSEIFDLYVLISRIVADQPSPRMVRCLEEIAETEKLLYHYDTLFRTLQTRPFWRLEEVLAIPLLSVPVQFSDYSFPDEERTQLLNKLKGPVEQFVLEAVERNALVSRRRSQSAPWMEYFPARREIRVYYPDGKIDYQVFKPGVEYNNSFFFPSYLSLFNQIEKPHAINHTPGTTS